MEDKRFKIECSTIENTFVNYASRVTIERCQLLKKMHYIKLHMSLDQGLLTTIRSIYIRFTFTVL